MTKLYLYITRNYTIVIMFIILFTATILSIFLSKIHLINILFMLLILMKTLRLINLFVAQNCAPKDEIKRKYLIKKYTISSLEPILYIPSVLFLIFFVLKFFDIEYIFGNANDLYPILSLFVFLLLWMSSIPLLFILRLNDERRGL